MKVLMLLSCFAVIVSAQNSYHFPQLPPIDSLQLVSQWADDAKIREDLQKKYTAYTMEFWDNECDKAELSVILWLTRSREERAANKFSPETLRKKKRAVKNMRRACGISKKDTK